MRKGEVKDDSRFSFFVGWATAKMEMLSTEVGGKQMAEESCFSHTTRLFGK